MSEHPPASDAADSDCRGPFGDSHIPGAYEAGDLTMEDELEIMYGDREHGKERQCLERLKRLRKEDDEKNNKQYLKMLTWRAKNYTYHGLKTGTPVDPHNT